MINRWLERNSTRIQKWFTEFKAKKAPKKHNAIFWSLTPKDDLDLKIYEQAIDYAFKKKDIHNVAISGAYGAGKSSIIASYGNTPPTPRRAKTHRRKTGTAVAAVRAVEVR